MEVDGAVVIEKVAGKSAVSRCFSKYPIKFIIPRKVRCFILIIFFSVINQICSIASSGSSVRLVLPKLMLFGFTLSIMAAALSLYDE